ncbi:MAG TPA: flotillin domain-containing protein, partial [Oceanipulchritudo sp.]|nr:flotillin domain-containing protein [Oceanipulchritudo sp.]
IRVADANATATEGENLAAVQVANSHADRRVKEAEAERQAITSEKVAAANALKDSYVAEEAAEKQRAVREKATQEANIIVPAQIEREKAIVDAEAMAESIRRTEKGNADAVRLRKQADADGIKFVKSAEADGLRFHLTAEADGTRMKLLAEAEGVEALLKNKAKGFAEIIAACNSDEQAKVMLVIEQLPKLVEEQVKAISNLKIDKVTVWDSGKSKDGKGSTADFLSGLVGALPPVHELTRNVGIELPEFLGRITNPKDQPAPQKPKPAQD